MAFSESSGSSASSALFFWLIVPSLRPTPSLTGQAPSLHFTLLAPRRFWGSGPARPLSAPPRWASGFGLGHPLLPRNGVCRPHLTQLVCGELAELGPSGRDLPLERESGLGVKYLDPRWRTGDASSPTPGSGTGKTKGARWIWVAPVLLGWEILCVPNRLGAQAS